MVFGVAHNTLFVGRHRMPKSNKAASENTEPVAKRPGYGSPPESGQFIKGLSGNPGGRPKKRVTQFDQIVIDSLEAVNASSDRTVLHILVDRFVREAVRTSDAKAARLIMEWYSGAKWRQSKSSTESGLEEQAARRLMGEHFSIFDEPVVDGAAPAAGTSRSPEAPDEDE